MENILTEKDLPESYGVEIEINTPETDRDECVRRTLSTIAGRGIPLMRMESGLPTCGISCYHEIPILDRGNPLAGWKVEDDCSLDFRYGSEWVSHILERDDFHQVETVVSILNDSGYRATKKGGIHLNYAHPADWLLTRNFDSLFVLGWDAIRGIIPPRRRHYTIRIGERVNYAVIPYLARDYEYARNLYADTTNPTYMMMLDRPEGEHTLTAKNAPHHRKGFGTEIRYFPSNLVWDDIQAYFFLVGRMLRIANSTTLIATNPEWNTPLERDDPMLDFLNRLGVSGGSVANHILGMWDDWKEWEHA